MFREWPGYKWGHQGFWHCYGPFAVDEYFYSYPSPGLYYVFKNPEISEAYLEQSGRGWDYLGLNGWDSCTGLSNHTLEFYALRNIRLQ